jgi:hypothetical protein
MHIATSFSNTMVTRYMLKVDEIIEGKTVEVPASLGKRLISVYERARSDRGSVALSYIDALPCAPPRIDDDRETTYRRLLGKRARRFDVFRGDRRC